MQKVKIILNAYEKYFASLQLDFFRVSSSLAQVYFTDKLSPKAISFEKNTVNRKYI